MKIIFLLFAVTFSSCLAGTPLRRTDQPFIDAAPYVFMPAQDLSGSDSLLPLSQVALKNKGKAMFMSLLIPGLGQRYAEADGKAAVFFGIEIGLWLTYCGFTAHGDWRENDYKNLAAAHANVNLEGKNHTYFIDVGNFDDIYEHNEYRLRQRDWANYYQDVDFWYWNWSSRAYRDKFDELRIASDTADNRAKFVLGAIVANHIISAIDAVWSVYQHDKKQLSNIDWDVRFGDGHFHPTFNLHVIAHF
ncbi:hypothetical protein JXA02_05000 [candidate division KSB1 bacterium]|nr:hypothetical protein [candidate division KSB1 bacterium]RQW08436.1 MAG: hypothetical protein EH222_05675 [candidate division KSB1 bacterium]